MTNGNKYDQNDLCLFSFLLVMTSFSIKKFAFQGPTEKEQIDVQGDI